MGLLIFCRGCGYEHDNLWSCERARLVREREAYAASVTPLGTAISGPAETPVEKTAEKTGGVPEDVNGLRARLAATEAKLAEMLEKQRAIERKKKARHRANTRVKQGR